MHPVWMEIFATIIGGLTVALLLWILKEVRIIARVPERLSIHEHDSAVAHKYMWDAINRIRKKIEA